MAQLTREALKDQFESFKRTHHVSDSMDDLIDSVWNMVDDGEGGGGTSSVKVYAAQVQFYPDNTNPTVTSLLQNTLGGVPVWTRFAAGVYRLTLSGAFPLLKTFIYPCIGATIPWSDGALLPNPPQDANYCRFDFDDIDGNNADTDNIAHIRIEVYP